MTPLSVFDKNPSEIADLDRSVLVWTILWRELLPESGTLAATLLPAELERCSRFRLFEDQMRHLICRGLLRRILAAALCVSPREVPLQASAHGKPCLPGSLASGLECNASHSGDYLLLALCRNALIGVDVEQIRPSFDFLPIARRFFSPAEFKGLKSLPPPLRERAFFSCWTRKEAVVKALGLGLSFPLDSFSVPVTPFPEIQLQDLPHPPHDDCRWHIADLSTCLGAPFYAASLAVRDCERQVIMVPTADTCRRATNLL